MDEVIEDCSCAVRGLRMSPMRVDDWIKRLRWPYMNRQAWFTAMLRGNTSAGAVLRAIFDTAVNNDKKFGMRAQSFRLEKERIAATTGLRPASLKSPIALLSDSGLIHSAPKGFPRTTYVYPCLSLICAAIAQGCGARIELPYAGELLFPGTTFTTHKLEDECEDGFERDWGWARDMEPELDLAWPDPKEEHRARLLTLHHLVREEDIKRFFSPPGRTVRSGAHLPLDLQVGQDVSAFPVT